MRNAKKPQIIDRRNEENDAKEARARDAIARAESAERSAVADANSRTASTSDKRARVSDARTARASADAAQAEAGPGTPSAAGAQLSATDADIDRIEAEQSRERARGAAADRGGEGGQPRQPAGASGQPEAERSTEPGRVSPVSEQGAAPDSKAKEPSRPPTGDRGAATLQYFEGRQSEQVAEREANARIVRPSEHNTARQRMELKEGIEQYERSQAAATADNVLSDGRADFTKTLGEQMQGPRAHEAQARAVEQDVRGRQGSHPYEEDLGPAFPGKPRNKTAPDGSDGRAAPESVVREVDSAGSSSRSAERRGPHDDGQVSDSESKPRKPGQEHRAGSWSTPAQTASDAERQEMDGHQRDARSELNREARSRHNDRAQDQQQEHIKRRDDR